VSLVGLEMFDNANAVVVASGQQGRFDTTLLHLGFEQLGNPVVPAYDAPKYYSC